MALPVVRNGSPPGRVFKQDQGLCWGPVTERQRRSCLKNRACGREWVGDRETSTIWPVVFIPQGSPEPSENGMNVTGLSHMGPDMSREASDHLQKEERKLEPLARLWSSMSLVGLSMSREWKSQKEGQRPKLRARRTAWCELSPRPETPSAGTREASKSSILQRPQALLFHEHEACPSPPLRHSRPF